MRAYRWLTLTTAVLITGSVALVFASGTAHAASPGPCEMRLGVVLTPDVPDPRDPGFLSSLLSNHPGYRLTLLEQDPGSSLVLDLLGPGPEYQCRNVIETMRRDARVLSVDVQMEPVPVRALSVDTADSDDEQAVAVTAPVVQDKSNTHLSLAGLGSLFWAAGHPAQAWKIVTPVQPGGVAYADLAAQCAVASSESAREAACP